jgi:hypothetical protein
MERIWKSLSESRMSEGLREAAPLHGLVNRNLWITATELRFRAHLKAVAFRQDTLWDCRVYSDKDLLSAWLKTARAQGHKIYDTQLDEDVGFAAMDIDELVEPPGLVILMLGVKTTPNKEGPNCLLEALTCRKHISRPTWIVDQPDQQVDRPHHRFYSDTLDSLLSHWPHIQLTKTGVSMLSEATVSPVAETKLADVAESSEAASEIDEMLDDLDPEAEPEEEEIEEEEEESEEEEPAGLLSGLDSSPAEDKKKKKFGKKKVWKKR